MKHLFMLNLGRAVKVLHDESLRLQPINQLHSFNCKRKDVPINYPPLTLDSQPISTCQNPVTKGGDVNFGPTYHAVHIRRGDFQYKHTRLPAEKVLNYSITNLVNINIYLI